MTPSVRFATGRGQPRSGTVDVRRAAVELVQVAPWRYLHLKDASTVLGLDRELVRRMVNAVDPPLRAVRVARIHHQPRIVVCRADVEAWRSWLELSRESDRVRAVSMIVSAWRMGKR